MFTKDNKTTVEILLYEIRTKKGYTCEELSKKSGISGSSINNIENGVNSPTLETLKKLAIALDCKIKDLYTDI